VKAKPAMTIPSAKICLMSSTCIFIER
jgi:hypothetical protein